LLTFFRLNQEKRPTKNIDALYRLHAKTMTKAIIRSKCSKSVDITNNLLDL